MRFEGFFQTPPVVKNLIIINVLFFLATSLLPNGLGDLIGNKLALYFWESDNFHLYQLVTHMFLHADITHLFFNMFAFWMFGRILEYDLGSKRFLTYYLITGIGAALLFMCVNWLNITIERGGMPAGYMTQSLFNMINTPMVGASGAVFGVLLAFGMLHPNSEIMLMIPPIPMKAKYFVIGYGVLELVLGFLNSGGNIAHFAHVGGMLWGFILLKYWKTKGKIFY